MVIPSNKLKQFTTYAFYEIDRAKEIAVKKGFKIIDFGVGDPTEPLYEGAIKALQEGAVKHARSGYPSYVGMKDLREKCSEWIKRRFNVYVDPEEQITITAGAKEAIFHFPMAFLNDGDEALIPSIGYPPYKAGTVFAGGRPVYYKLKEENDFLPDPEEIKKLIKENRNVKLIYLNYPNNPTSKLATRKIYEELVEISNEYDIILASDECYCEIYFDEKPISILNVTDDYKNIVVFNSLSKRSNATGLRVGFVYGDKEIIKYFRMLKMQIDSGIPNSIQEAAIAALSDEKHVEDNRELYRMKRDMLIKSLKELNIKYYAESTFYVWARLSENTMETSKNLLELDKEKRIGINVTPSKMLSLDPEETLNSYVRFALVPSVEDIELASELLLKNPWK
jgi:Aspartate/tyrosine/aromatic aminotransferase